MTQPPVTVRLERREATREVCETPPIAPRPRLTRAGPEGREEGLEVIAGLLRAAAQRRASAPWLDDAGALDAVLRSVLARLTQSMPASERSIVMDVLRSLAMNHVPRHDASHS